MDYELSEEQLMLRSSARDFLEKEDPRQLLRGMAADTPGYSPELWHKIADLGWLGLALPTDHGGASESFLNLMVLLEECGRALLPGPFIPNVVLAGRVIAAAGTDDQKRTLLPHLADGSMIMTAAIMEASGSVEASGVAATATRDGDEFLIDGTKLFVPHADAADSLVCIARTSDAPDPANGLTLFLVETTAAGVEIDVQETITDERLCQVTFDSVHVPYASVLGMPDHGWPLVSRMLTEAAVAECAWMVGGARWVLETSVEYARARVQFERPIGSFQAIQHKCADMAIAVEGAAAIAYYAAWAIAEEDPDMNLIASMSKAWCGDAYERVAAQGIQVHGGIGFTWDYDLQLYFKRARASQLAFGDAGYHRGRVATMLDF